jgi:hypothetical protein
MGVIEILASNEQGCVNEIFLNDIPEVIRDQEMQPGQRVMASHRRSHRSDPRVDEPRLNFGSGGHPGLIRGHHGQLNGRIFRPRCQPPAT